MKSPVVKRSIVIAGHKTSVSLEDAFWRGLKEIAAARSMTLSDLVASIDTGRDLGNLSSAIRLFVLDHYRSLAAGRAMDDGVTAHEGNGADNHDMMLPRGDVIPLRADGASFRQNS
jgi:predicted DNA-binding ribbon-helix-helix protein